MNRYAVAMNIAAKPSNARVQRSRESLQAALLTLLDSRDFDAITVAEIVQTAGVGYATFYRHYVDKQALWTATVDSLILELQDRMIPGLDRGDHHGSTLDLCRYIEDHKSVYRVLIAGGAKELTRSAMVDHSRAISEARHDMDIHGLPPMVGAMFAVNAVFSILAWWMEESPDLSAEAIADIIDQLVFTPLFSLIRRH